MRSYHSDMSLFSPINTTIPEGMAKFRAHIENAMRIRNYVPEKEGKTVIPYDANGLFGKSETQKYIVLVLVPDDTKIFDKPKPYLWFAKKFAVTYLKKESMEGSINYTTLKHYDKTKEYNAAIWVQKNNAALPGNISFLDTVLAVDEKGKPVFVFDADDIELMETLSEEQKTDMAVKRMNFVWSRYLEHNETGNF